MAEEAKKTQAKKKSTPKQKADNVSDVVTNTEDVVEESTAKKKIRAKDVDLNQYITVLNGFQGRLIYRSRRTNEVFVWAEFGDEQEMELRELVNAKSSWKKYFINNWFMFNDEDKWVLDYLGMNRFYRNALSIEEFDELFLKDADEIKRILSNMSEGQKKSASYRARRMIADGKIDSLKTISIIENVLGVELTEK